MENDAVTIFPKRMGLLRRGVSPGDSQTMNVVDGSRWGSVIDGLSHSVLLV